MCIFHGISIINFLLQQICCTPSYLCFPVLVLFLQNSFEVTGFLLLAAGCIYEFVKDYSF